MRTTGWIIFLAAFGVMAGLLGNEIRQFETWAPVLTPQFLGTALIHIGTVIGAFIGGKLLPQPGSEWDGRDRRG